MVDGKIESFLAYDMCLKRKMVRWNHFWTNDICDYDMESCNMRRKIEFGVRKILICGKNLTIITLIQKGIMM